jgi:hypothetical protein
MPKKKTTPAQKFAKIFELFTRGATAEERATAEAMMDQWLRRHSKTRADIPSILAQALADDAASQPPPSPSDPRDDVPVSAGSGVNALDVIHRLLELYVCGHFTHMSSIGSRTRRGCC